MKDMKISGKHIHPIFNICILLIGFTLYSVNPMNTHSNKHSQGPTLQIHSETYLYSEITKNDKLPDGEESDIKNVGKNRYGGAIAAALFLSEFTGKTPWAHIDIAGPAYASGGSDYCQPGGTGFGVRLLVDVIENL